MATVKESRGDSGPADGDDIKNVLVVANEAVAGTEIGEALLHELEGKTLRVCLISPALVDSALDHQMGQIDRAIEPARARLKQSLEQLHQLGIEAVGEVADSDPILAISDELQKFQADEIILITHTESDRAFAEKDLLERVHHDFSQPVTQLTVTRTGRPGEPQPEPGEEPRLVSVEHEGPGQGSEAAEREVSENFPPLRLRDIAAMVTGAVGSILLVILAADSALNEPGSGIEGVSAAKMLLAIGALLINGAHIVALIFFQSVRYEGIFERFMSTFTITVTTVAVIVSLLL